MDRRTFLAAAGLAAAVTPVCATTPTASPLARPSEGFIKVACAISLNTTEIDFIGPVAVFETWHRDTAGGRPSKQFEIFTVSQTRDPQNGRIADYTFEDAPAPNVVVVPAQTGSDALLDWLRRVHQTADVTMSVCVGARFLAEAGLLDGLSATTHHESIDRFERDYPRTRWVRDTRYIENEKISTAGGLTSGIDLALHVVERYFDRAAAQQVADHIEYAGTRWINPAG